jgi:hypothetical protein
MRKHKFAVKWLVAALSTVALAQGCGSSGTTSRDAGASGQGGAAGAAGSGAAGFGFAGGGAAGTGVAGTGVAGAGIAGATDAGAGSTGAAGADAAADAPADATTPPPDGSQDLTDTFDTTAAASTWHFSPYGSTPDNMPTAANNLATLSTLAWDGTDDADGLTTSGSLKGTVAFRSVGDRIDFQAFTQATALYNWTGYQITAKVKLVSGGNLTPGCPLSAWLYVSQVGYNTSLSTPVNLSTGTWVTVTYDMADATIDVSQINQMGLQMTTGAVCLGDAGASDAATDASADGAADGGVDGDAAADSAVDGRADASDAATLMADAGLTDGGSTDSADASDAPDALPVTATTAVILVDDVIVAPK